MQNIKNITAQISKYEDNSTVNPNKLTVAQEH